MDIVYKYSHDRIEKLLSHKVEASMTRRGTNGDIRIHLEGLSGEDRRFVESLRCRGTSLEVFVNGTKAFISKIKSFEAEEGAVRGILDMEPVALSDESVDFMSWQKMNHKGTNWEPGAWRWI